MGRGDTRVSDNEGVRREKVNGREKKRESLPWEREDTKKLCFPRLKTKIIFIGDATREREIVFQIFFFGKQPIENKPYFYLSFPLTKDSFLLIRFFLYYQTLENVENYLYRKFSSETNRVEDSR